LPARQGVAATGAGVRLYDKARLDVLWSVEKPSGQAVAGMPHSLMSVLALPLLQQATERLPERFVSWPE
jgi:hypothetical protein